MLSAGPGAAMAEPADGQPVEPSRGAVASFLGRMGELGWTPIPMGRVALWSAGPVSGAEDAAVWPNALNRVLARELARNGREEAGRS